MDLLNCYNNFFSHISPVFQTLFQLCITLNRQCPNCIFTDFSVNLSACFQVLNANALTVTRGICVDHGLGEEETKIIWILEGLKPKYIIGG